MVPLNQRDFTSDFILICVQQAFQRVKTDLKLWITLKGKAFRGLKAERTPQYVSISIRETTPPLSVRRSFRSVFSRP
jgi:hypothetical protein